MVPHELEGKGPQTEYLSPDSSTTPSTKVGEKEYDVDSPDGSATMNHEIEELARRLSRHSTTAGEASVQAFSPELGSRLDPSSPNFDPRAWVKAFVRLTDSEEGSAPSRSLGVAFKGLNVYGWGSGAGHQKTLVDYPIDVVRFFARLLGGCGKKGDRVDILRDFEGVVEEGELLMVLGPPGSGCSTLLKTISGETAGLEVDPDSYMNFRGEH